jgi:two-component system, OmpR family, sensor histidine kinase PrrB
MNASLETRAAGRIAAEYDLDVRVSEADGPAEVRRLAASFNTMLARLSASALRERALEATRPFAFDAGHELRGPLTTVQATVSALHGYPDAPPEHRAAMLEDAFAEQRRLVANLVTNAAHRGRSGGNVWITLAGRRTC